MKLKTRSTRATTSGRFPAWPSELCAFLICLSTHARALEPAVGHVELEPHYETATNVWDWPTFWFDDDLNLRADPVSTLYFPGFDVGPQDFGVRNNRPAASKWDFLGMSAGEPVWVFNADTSHASPGFAATQSNLSGNLTFTLAGVSGPEGGFFSLYSGSTPDVFMKTIDGIDGTDVFSKPPQHTHVNWAFSKKGLWIVNLKVQGTLASGGSPTSISAPQPVVFAIGDFAMWKSSRFTMTGLQNPAISANSADPDGDGWNNLMEYALGGDPEAPSAMRETGGQPLAPRLVAPATGGAPWTFRYFRRIAGNQADISYQVESSANPGSGAWLAETGAATIISADDQWEEISVPLAAGSPRFFRLKVMSIP